MALTYYLMLITSYDWLIICAFFVSVFLISFMASKSAGKSKEAYFLAGKSMPWWLLGISMVATTFSVDTPNLVTNFVREGGVSKNWLWWSFLITGIITVFIYSRLWRRSSVFTDLEFYELRYGGKAASFLRGFRALYLGVFFNCLIMGSVTLAAIKMATIFFDMEPLHTVILASIIVGIYSAIGGIKGIIWTDFFQFGIAIIGAIYAAHIALSQPKVGGLSGLLAHQSLVGKLDILPDFNDPSVMLSMFIIPLAVQWWSVWYPGSEPGGGGYIAQRMLAAKNEKQAMGATLFFNFAHYALRPWPWILVALASIILFPDLEAISVAFPSIKSDYLGEDIAYPVMLTLLSPGWLGLVLASLIAAYMSTISTHLNWGSSYVVNDFYQRFVKPKATERELVLVGRISTILLMIIAGIFALTVLKNASQAFSILLLSGAGTGAIFLLRWFWWRINAWTEIVGMIVATINAFVLILIVPDEAVRISILDAGTSKLLIATGITTIAWVTTAFVTTPESKDKLQSFVDKVTPPIGWKSFNYKRNSNVKYAIMSVFVSTIGIYSALFSVGNFLYGEWLYAITFLMLFLGAVFLIIKWWGK